MSSLSNRKEDGKEEKYIEKSTTDEKRIVVISGDYDGCFDSLCKDFKTGLQYQHILRLQTSENLRERKAGKSLEEKLKGEIAVLEAELELISSGKTTIFYNGSSRQNEDSDKKNSWNNSNGMLKENYPELTKKKGWNYNRKTINPSNIPPIYSSYVFGLLRRRNEFLTQYNPFSKDFHGMKEDIALKIAILAAQLDDAARKYSKNKPFDFHFFDDRIDVIQGLNAYFSEHPDKIPSGITLHLRQFDYVDRLNQEQRKQPIDDIVLQHRPLEIKGVKTLPPKEPKPQENPIPTDPDPNKTQKTTALKHLLYTGLSAAGSSAFFSGGTALAFAAEGVTDARSLSGIGDYFSQTYPGWKDISGAEMIAKIAIIAAAAGVLGYIAHLLLDFFCPPTQAVTEKNEDSIVKESPKINGPTILSGTGDV